MAAGCERTAQSTQELIHNTRNLYRYRSILQCWTHDDNGGCIQPEPCDDPPGTEQYSLERQPLTGGEWEHSGMVCLTDPGQLEQRISTQMVLTEFRRLDWPAAQLTIQPPDGRTLVNLETIFYTDSPTTVTRIVTLLGQQVTITAEVEGYTWHWTTDTDNTTGQVTDADREPLVTTDPGRPHPHQTITHTYIHAGVAVHPRLDVTYRGRYRVGDGPWTDIPETRTIEGTPTELTVLEARPVLVR